MKKFMTLALALIMVLSLVACGEDKTDDTKKDPTPAATTEEVKTDAPATTEAVKTDAPATTEEVKTDAPATTEGAAVMSFEEYNAIVIDDDNNNVPVVIESYVQAKQSWWKDAASFYLQDEEGAYFVYNAGCTEEEFNALVPGTHVRVTGKKTAWSGENEIVEATIEVVDDKTFTAEAVDVTELVGTDDMAKYQNALVSFTDMTVVAVSYKNNEPGDDIYVTLSKNDTKVEFCLEYYLNGSDEEFYNLVGGLTAGQVVDVTCILYWYEGPDGHLTTVTVK